MTDEDIEREWKEFWEPIVCPNGVLDLEQVKKELFDFRVIMQNVSRVYDHVTGGRISKVTTDSQHVIDEYENTIRREMEKVQPILQKLRKLATVEDDPEEWIESLIGLIINYDNS